MSYGNRNQFPLTRKFRMFPISKPKVSLLMFLHAFAIGAYSVPLATVMKAKGMEHLIVYPLVIAAIAAFISPMIVGSLADRKYAPERLLAVVTLGSGLLMTVVGLVLAFDLGPTAFMLAMSAYFLWASPGWGLLTSIGLMNVGDPQREFAPVRVWATIGFMAGVAFVSFVMLADRSPVSNFVAAGVFLAESLFCFTLPLSKPPPQAAPKRLRDYFGWDAVQLMRDRDHRMIFLTSALFSIPIVLFYPFCSNHLDQLKVEHPSGILSIAQISEVVGMVGLALIMGRFRLKWLILAGMVLGALRYLFFSTSQIGWIIAGISLHGLIYTLFYMTTQIYLEQRVPHQLRNQSQAFLQVMTSGIGNLTGLVLGHFLKLWCTQDGITNWTKFWNASCLIVLATTVFFAIGYRGAAKRTTKPTAEA